MDKDMKEYDISGQRLPRYSSIVRTGETYKVTNTGRKPKNWKW